MHVIKTGDCTVMSLQDTTFAMSASELYPELSHTQRQAFSRFLDFDGRYVMPCLCFLVRTPTSTVLIDAGMGPGGEAALLDELATAHVDLNEIDAVVLTHLHPDHVGWLYDEEGAQATFPRARILVSRIDWTATSSSGDRVPPWHTLFDSGLVVPVEDGHAIDEYLSVTVVPGHTPGHLAVLLDARESQTMFVGDVLISPLDVAVDGLRNVYDEDSKLAAASRRALLDECLLRGRTIAASHLPAPGLGRVVQEASGLTWVTV